VFGFFFKKSAKNLALCRQNVVGGILKKRRAGGILERRMKQRGGNRGCGGKGRGDFLKPVLPEETGQGYHGKKSAAGGLG